MHTAELLVPEPSSFKVEIIVEELKRCKLAGIDQISVELTQPGGNTLRSEIHELISSVWNKEELPQQWKESIIVLIINKRDKTNGSKYRGKSL
jgi:hypothetical protein